MSLIKNMNPKKIHFCTLLCSIFAIFEWHDFKESDIMYDFFYLRLIQQCFRKLNLSFQKVTWTVDSSVQTASVQNDEVERFWIIERFRISKDFWTAINHDQKFILCLNGIKRIAGTFMNEHQWNILETSRHSPHNLWCNNVYQHLYISSYHFMVECQI